MPKGKYPNKGAKPANPVGRPCEFDRVQVAKDMIEWAKQPDSININKFCALHDPIIPPATFTRWRDEDPEFRAAYECVKLFLAFRREEKLNSEQLHVKAYDLNATVYDYFLREEKLLMMKHESDLKAKSEQAKYDLESLKQLSAVMDQIKSTQSDK